ncbi:MAG: YcxB family protein [Kiritimatiellae bacterium]|nr:YcxB family protein [Kiritimatiellia bacterium]
MCRHELELTEAGLVERTDVGEHHVLFQGIERVDSTATHSYLFIGTMQAHVIPHAKITEGDLSAFLDELKRRMKGVSPVNESVS